MTEVLARERATGEILRMIRDSPTNEQAVFEAIVSSAWRLLGGFGGAFGGAVYRVIGEELHLEAYVSTNPTGDAALKSTFPRPLSLFSPPGEAIRRRAPVVLVDVDTDEWVPDDIRELIRKRGDRSGVWVPMMREGMALGAIGVTRSEPGSFGDEAITLLRTFADQAVMAIENVRLFTELQEKNRALTEAHSQVSEALDQQTATAEILRIISQSRTDVQPVFDAIALSAMRLCGGDYASVFRVEGDQLVPMQTPMSPEHADFLRQQYPRPIDTTSMVGRAVIERRVVHVPDLADPSAPPRITHEASDLIRRAQLTVPMLRNAEPVGVIAVSRREPGAFSEPQIELLKTFADQAVIAIENARLLAELQARTHELTRSVEQLTALGDVGRAVSSSLDLDTVLETIVGRAVQLSGLDGGVVFEYDEGVEEFVQRVATDTDALAEARRTTRIRKGEGVLGRTAITLEPVQVPNITVPGAYEGRLREALIESGVRAILAVPMIYEGRLIGCLGVTRNGPGNFPAETIELLRTFATQSALAIQNARLFREIADKSRQLEAASRHKSEFLANMSHELRTPLNAIIGFSEVLAQGLFGEVNDKQSEYLHDILESGRHLLSLINDILDLSKIEAGRMELEVSEFDLPQAIQNALTLVRERALRRGIALHHVIDDRVAEIRADERKVKQVLLNLLSNAIKFTPEGGGIDVRATPTDGMVEVSVTDTGVGIAPEDQEAVFEEFRQVGAADKKAEGTGLGLALARKFVELHGGRIAVHSQVGAGSTFTFTLPVHGRVSPLPAG